MNFNNNEKVFELLKGKPTAYMILSYLNNTSMNCVASVSIKTIQEDLGIGSNKTVITALKLLEDKELIQIAKEKSTDNRIATNKYILQ